MAAFSTTDEAVLTAPLELNPLAQSATASSSGRSIYYVYDILSTAAKIHSGGFKRVALQFPDEALVDSVPVYWALKSETRKLYSADAQSANTASVSTSTSALGSNDGLPQLYILADTSYGGCCVDEVAAKHVDADLAVHYGHACLSATARLPVIYVFTKQPLEDVSAAATSLAEETSRNICSGDPSTDIEALVLTYDVSWDHVIDDVFHATQQALKEQGVTLPLVRTHVDFRRNYEDKLYNAESVASGAALSSECGGAVGGSCCNGVQQVAPSSCCNGSTCVSANSTSTEFCATPTSRLTSTCPSSASSVSQLIKEIGSDRSSQPLGPSRSVTLPPGIDLSQCGYLYLGPESLSLTNLLLTLGAATRLISYNPLTGRSRVETGSTNRLLMKRYACVLKARDASVVGLLVGTLGVHSYLPLLKYLRQLLTAKPSRRKVYTISVGKLNPAKLANFQEIDVFVLVACPENTLVDSKEFFRPIVTPFEMELAVKAAQRHELGQEGVDWSGKYVLDFERLVPHEFKSNGIEANGLNAKMHSLQIEQSDNVDQVESEREPSDDDQPHFSLISGTYVHRRKFNAKSTSSTSTLPTPQQDELQMIANQAGGANEDQVLVRNATSGQLTTVLETASIAHLKKRGWKGLEQRLGMDEPSVLEEGRQGIAKGYKDAGGEGEIM